MFIDTQIILGGEKMKNTKKSLIASGISLAVSVALLAGSTFAWFTDSVTNKGNKIQAGSLAVELWNGNTEITDSSGPVFNYDEWEPGYSTGADLWVRNAGTLALKYELEFQNIQTSGGIENVIDVTVNGEAVGTLADYIGGKNIAAGVLKAGESGNHSNIVLKMRESAGNEYQEAYAAFDILLKATQYTFEADGFGDTLYDGEAAYDDGGYSIAPVTVTEEVVSGADTVLKDQGVTVTVPADSTAEDTVTLTIEDGVTPDSVQAPSGSTVVTYEINLVNGSGEAVSLTEPAVISLFVGKGLANVILYHNSQPVTDAVYDMETGIITFETDSFSPFTVVYDGKAVAFVNGNAYASFSEALIAANNGGTVELLSSPDTGYSFGYTEAWVNEGVSSKNPNSYGKNVYAYTLNNVTVTSAGGERAVIKGIDMLPAKVTETDPQDSSLDSYYTKLSVDGLAFRNIDFTDAVKIGSTITGLSALKNISFENCTFDMTESDETYKDALLIKAPSGLQDGDVYVSDGITVKNCEFLNCRRSISLDKAKNTNISGNNFSECTYGLYGYNILGKFVFSGNVLSNGEGAIRINTVSNNYAAHDYSSDITVTGNIMTGMTQRNGYFCYTAYDNGKQSGKTEYTVSDNYWGAAEGVTAVKGFRIKTTYSPSVAQTIEDTAPRTSPGQ